MNGQLRFTFRRMVSSYFETVLKKCGHFLFSTSIYHQRRGIAFVSFLSDIQIQCTQLLTPGYLSWAVTAKGSGFLSHPVLEELNMLSNGVPAFDIQTNSAFLLKAHLVLLSGDTPGVSKLLHLSGYVAKYPCHACKLEGTLSKITFQFQKGPRKGQMGERTAYYYPLHPPTNTNSVHTQRSPASFVEDIKNLPRRTPDGYVHDGETSLQDPQHATDSGVKGICISLLPPCNHFNSGVCSIRCKASCVFGIGTRLVCVPQWQVF